MADFENINNGEEESEILLLELGDEVFEILDALTYEGTDYLAITPYNEDADYEDEESEEEIDVIIVQEVEDGYATVDDDELFAKLGAIFLERIDELMEDADPD